MFQDYALSSYALTCALLTHVKPNSLLFTPLDRRFCSPRFRTASMPYTGFVAYPRRLRFFTFEVGCC